MSTSSHDVPRRCGKRYFPDRISAQLSLLTVWRHGGRDDRPAPRRAYRCPHCLGWHLTSHTSRPRSVRRGERIAVGKEAAAVAFTASFRRRHGRGPTWRELSIGMGWPVVVGSRAIGHLIEEGWLTHDGTPHLLRPGPCALPRPRCSVRGPQCRHRARRKGARP